MMALATSHPHLIDRLAKPRGRLAADAPLGPQTWFGTGGPAEVLFRPADTEDLASFLKALPRDVPVTVLGVGSNLLVRDGGVKGVVIRLMRGFTGIAVEGNELLAGAGALDLNVALTAREHALAGLEFLSGVPGTIGGAVAMNAGAYGGELAEVLISAEAVDRAGKVHHVSASELGFSYRHSNAPADWIFTSALPPRPTSRSWARKCGDACWRKAASVWNGKSAASGCPHEQGRGPDGRLVARARGLAGKRQGLRRGPARRRPRRRRIRRQTRPACASRFPAP